MYEPLPTSTRSGVSMLRVYFPGGAEYTLRSNGNKDLMISLDYVDGLHSFSIFQRVDERTLEPLLVLESEDYSRASLWFLGDPYARLLQGTAA